MCDPRAVRLQGDREELALQYYRECLHLAVELGDLGAEGRLRNVLGMLSWKLADGRLIRGVILAVDLAFGVGDETPDPDNSRHLFDHADRPGNVGNRLLVGRLGRRGIAGLSQIADGLGLEPGL